MNSTPFTYPEITQKFLEFENKHQLLSLNINGVFPWQIARITIFLHIVDATIPGNAQPNTKTFPKKITNILHRLFINCLFFNPFLDCSQKNALIIESGRKYRDEDAYIDIYTEYIAQFLEQKKVSFTRYETNYNLDLPMFKRSIKIKHLDFIFIFSQLKQKFIKTRFSEKDTQIISQIAGELSTLFGVKINLVSIFSTEIKKFKAEFGLYYLLFKLKKPKEIYLTNSCDKPALIDAAKKNKILVNELQHGLMSDKDVISNFPFTPENSLEYFPDVFYIWDNVEMFFGKLPLPSHNIKPMKNEHIDKWVKKLENLPTGERTLLVVSQPYGSKEMMNFIAENTSSLEKFTIFYKMHPAENEEVIAQFQELFANASNIKLINNEESMYVLLKKSKYVLGVYSSALFEASAFDCKVILLNLPGVEMSFPLLRNKKNILIETHEELVKVLT